jgi:hypothetical protein
MLEEVPKPQVVHAAAVIVQVEDDGGAHQIGSHHADPGDRTPSGETRLGRGVKFVRLALKPRKPEGGWGPTHRAVRDWLGVLDEYRTAVLAA